MKPFLDVQFFLQPPVLEQMVVSSVRPRIRSHAQQGTQYYQRDRNSHPAAAPYYQSLGLRPTNIPPPAFVDPRKWVVDKEISPYTKISVVILSINNVIYCLSIVNLYVFHPNWMDISCRQGVMTAFSIVIFGCISLFRDL